MGPPLQPHHQHPLFLQHHNRYNSTHCHLTFWGSKLSHTQKKGKTLLVGDGGNQKMTDSQTPQVVFVLGPPLQPLQRYPLFRHHSTLHMYAYFYYTRHAPNLAHQKKETENSHSCGAKAAKSIKSPNTLKSVVGLPQPLTIITT